MRPPQPSDVQDEYLITRIGLLKTRGDIDGIATPGLGSRRALLLAIADYDLADSIPYVRGDVPRMQRALNLMGIPASKIEAHGPGIEGSRDLSAARIRTLIQKFVDGAVEGENLIIYFSGHGLEQKGQRLLVPQDYDVNYPPRASELVSDVDLFAWSRRSKAASVLLLIDACRDGVRFTLAPDTDETKSLRPKPAQDGASSREVPTIAIVFSCASGRSNGKEQNSECSGFTRAFAEALEAEDELGSLNDVIAAAQRRLNAFGATDQTITLGDLRSPGRMGRAETLIVKASQAAQFQDRLKNSAWVSRIKKVKPWQTVHGTAPALATQVCAIVLRAEDQVGKAAKKLPQQRWRTREAPFRMLDRIGSHLLTRLNLEPAEAAVLLAVPFIYEVALAAAEVRLAAEGDVLNPFAYEDQTSATRFWRAWRVAWANDQVEHRQIQRLRELGKLECAEDVAMWQLTTFCHRAGEFWDPVDTATSQSGWVAKEVAEALSPAPLDEVRAHTRIGAILALHRLLRFARLMFASFEDVVLDFSAGKESRLSQDIHFGEGAGELRLNEVKVGHLLNLGARLALDARRLPSVLLEHLGSEDRLNLRAVQNLLARAEWHDHNNNVLSLGLTCPHEALDAALRESVDDLDAYRRHIFNRSDQQHRLLGALPVSFNANDLIAESYQYQGKLRYDTEHLRFTLDQRRVTSLLMGKELYGDPDLALRELYQNALDACRYRRAHEMYVRKLHKGPQYGPEHHGQIDFRFGTEEGGRRFIECHDNGIGMADRHLRRLFARAGHRFTDSHEYHLDKGRWEKEGINFFPSSRFGIGVLSYFMLAEELEVESQRVGLPDAPTPERVHARVLGSGSLFRLDREGTYTVLGGGTRVRLYLNDKERSLSDFRDSILEWLWLPEFRTSFVCDGTTTIDLPANRPTPKFEEERGPLLPISGSEDTTRWARVFWCLSPNVNDSILLADGILVRGARGPRSHIAVNLVEELRPELSVNRLGVISARKGIEFAERCIGSNGWSSLGEWKAPQLSVLLALLSSVPRVVGRFSDALRARKLPIPDITTNAAYSGANLPSSVGICDVDEILFASERGTNDSEWNPLTAAQVSVRWSRLLSARIWELAKARMQVPTKAELLARYMGRTISERCPPSTAQKLLQCVSRAPRGARWRDALSVADLLFFHRQYGLPMAEIAELVRPLSLWGIRVPDLDAFQDAPELSEFERRLLNSEFGGLGSFVGTLGFGHLLAARTHSRIPTTELAAAVRSLAARGIEVLGFDVLHESTVLTHQQLVILSRHFNGRAPYVDNLRLAHLMVAAKRLRLSIAELAELAELTKPLADLGISVADLRGSLNGPELSEPHLLLLSQSFDGKPPYDDTLSADRLLFAIKKFHLSADDLTEFGRAVGAPMALSIHELALAAQFEMSMKRTLELMRPVLPAFPGMQERLSRIEISDATEMLLLGLHSEDGGSPNSLSCWDLARTDETGSADFQLDPGAR
jgi:hypothetical protein